MQKRDAADLEELRKMEDVRNRLQGLQQVARSYQAGHNMRERLESMNIGQVLEMVENDITTLRNTLLHPGES
ncbi:MAG: hypothetical protein AVDCRST_MAG28-3295 [uncultured Rubrobacteraceae bacterium]|uniref:Uncharacterized protein n=1 Tax=uncultured Rubrobacteraceae bacterium TaxID=349277 RepID=A0A6J4R126_9ACTN|nr:MAG: hypothetical protein AVDCRST_MAG28-3295 [uncultured Rubrobacteraceae bacterium]